MTINQLVEKARQDAVEKTYKFYVEICDGEYVEEEIEADKLTGEYQREVERFTLNNIYSLIRTIKATELMSEEEKEQAIEYLHNTPEYRDSEKRVAMLFANHFVKYHEVYLK